MLLSVGSSSFYYMTVVPLILLIAPLSTLVENGLSFLPCFCCSKIFYLGESQAHRGTLLLYPSLGQAQMQNMWLYSKDWKGYGKALVIVWPPRSGYYTSP